MAKKKKKICIVGTGGFGREVLCCLIDFYRSTKINIFAKQDVYESPRVSVKTTTKMTKADSGRV